MPAALSRPSSFSLFAAIDRHRGLDDVECRERFHGAFAHGIRRNWSGP